VCCLREVSAYRAMLFIHRSACFIYKTTEQIVKFILRVFTKRCQANLILGKIGMYMSLRSVAFILSIFLCIHFLTILDPLVSRVLFLHLSISGCYGHTHFL
jgi:hypothetical protein